MGIRRSARRHQAVSQEVEESYWAFRPGQRVMTTDGFPGVVDEIQDGPYPGSEQYLVTLDGGMGGGTYSPSELSATVGGDAYASRSGGQGADGGVLGERLPGEPQAAEPAEALREVRGRAEAVSGTGGVDRGARSDPSGASRPSLLPSTSVRVAGAPGVAHRNGAPGAPSSGDPGDQDDVPTGTSPRRSARRGVSPLPDLSPRTGGAQEGWLDDSLEFEAARDPEVEAAMDLIASQPNVATPDARLASEDYAELAEILHERPPLAHAEPLVMRAAKTASSATGEAHLFEDPSGKWWWEYHDSEYGAGSQADGGPFDTSEQALAACRSIYSPSAVFKFRDGKDDWGRPLPYLPWEKHASKEAAAYYLQTPESEALYDAASTVLSQASQAMAVVDVPDESIENGTAYEIAKQRFAEGVMDTLYSLEAEAAAKHVVEVVISEAGKEPWVATTRNLLDDSIPRLVEGYRQDYGPDAVDIQLRGQSVTLEQIAAWQAEDNGTTAAKTDWARLHAYYVCENPSCKWAGDLEPITLDGKKVDVCPACGNVTDYEEIDSQGWPVAAGRYPVTPDPRGPYSVVERPEGWVIEDKNGEVVGGPGTEDQVRALHADLYCGPGSGGVSTAGLIDHMADFLNSQMKPEYQVKPGTSWSYDWCRFRKNERCFYPKTLNAEATKQAGYAVWNPEDRGVCPRNTWDEQKACPVSEPGPHSGDPKASVDATVSWEDGGQRPTGPGTIGPNDYRASLLTAGFEITAAWADVRRKAKRIRSEGGVRIISAPRPGDETLTVSAEVQGDNHVYETTLLREPGRHNVASWRCGCAWAAYAWGRSPAYKRFEGRMCSHALALQYEAQSQGMFGRQIAEQAEAPEWRKGNDPFTYAKPPRAGDHTRAAGLVKRGSIDHPAYDDEHFDVAPLTYIAATGGLTATAAQTLNFGGRLKALVHGTVKAIKFLVVNDMHKWEALTDAGEHVPVDDIYYPTYHPTRGLTVTHTASAADVEHLREHDVRHVEMPGGGFYPYDRPEFDPSQWGAFGAVEDDFLFEDGGQADGLGSPETAASYEATRTPQYLTFERARAAAQGTLHDDPEAALPTTDGDLDDDEFGFEAKIAMTIGISPDATPEKAADELLNWAHQHDALITGAVRDVCDATDGDMDSSFLPLRIKGRPRMIEKIEQDVKEKHLTPAQVAMRFSDALRFTVMYSTQDYADKTAEFLRQMATRGFRPDSPDRVKNFWLRDDPYDGVNSVLRGPDGFPFEVQFHTEQSMGLKNAIHPLYERFRDTRNPAPPQERRNLWDAMINAGATVERPTREYEIGLPTQHHFASTDEHTSYYAFVGDVPGEYNGVFRRVESPTDVRFERYSVSQDAWVEDNSLARHLVHGSIDVDPVDELTATIIVNASKRSKTSLKQATPDEARDADWTPEQRDAWEIEHAHTEAMVVDALVDPDTAPEMAEAVTATLVVDPPGPGDPRLSWLMGGGASGGAGAESGPSSATPQTAGNADIAAQAKAFLAKQALKSFSPAEQAEIINEGLDVQAANLGDLDITGTHYEGLEAAFKAAEEEEDVD